ncbi:DUF2771 domain-containing protein [uncultured Corynebacterium sp.]|uniref:DUF2771 domain-containing protein n=1 Tax=uncultured Corynebacterium sp. TaxID=159447 RepID=UPI0025D5A31B|nr:DUF2771 domain-containing protein [uncultured Corynebacterium sp.]
MSEQEKNDPKTSAKPAPKLSKKQQRKRAQRKQLLTMGAIVVLVVVVIGGVLLYNRWQDGKIETLPQEQRITAVVDGKELEIAPYSVCELDDRDCKPSEPHKLEVGDAKEVTLKLPEDVYNHDWSLLQIFDDPGANQDNYYKGDERQEVTLKTEADVKSKDGSTPKLKVLELHSMLIGLDDNDEQTPYATIWSIEIAQ